MARKALIGIVALLAVVFFTSVICPPVHERDALPDETVGIADTLPGSGDALTGARSPAAGSESTRETIPPAPSMAAVRFAVDLVDDQGKGLNGAIATLTMLEFEEVTGSQQAALEVSQAVSTDGEVFLRAPYPGSFLIRARMDNMLPAEMRVDLPLPESAERPRLVLPRAAFFTGKVQDRSGDAVVWGELVLTNVQTGEELFLQARGSNAEFRSAALAAGSWTLAWREHRHAEIDSRLIYRAPLAIGETLNLSFTLPLGEESPTAVVGVFAIPR